MMKKNINVLSKIIKRKNFNKIAILLILSKLLVNNNNINKKNIK